MSLIAGGQVNKFACTQAEEAQNWALVNQVITILYDFITEVESGTDAFTVMCSAADTTPGYLHAKIANQATYDSSPDIPIYGAIDTPAGDENLQLFIKADGGGIASYSGTGTYALCEVNGVPTWVNAATFSTADEKVKVSANDTTAGYLHAKFKDAAVADYAAGDFLIVARETDDAGDESVKLFFDSSVVPTYTGSGDMLLGLSGTTVTFFDAAAVGGGSVTAGTYIDISGTDINVDLTEVASYDNTKTQNIEQVSGTIQWGTCKVHATENDTTPSVLHDAIKDTDTYSSTNDGLVKTDTDGAGGTDQKERLFLDSSAITGWNASNNQALCHKAGTLQWIDLGTCS